MTEIGCTLSEKFQSTKFFSGQNFRYKIENSAVLSAEIFFEHEFVIILVCYDGIF